MTHPHPLNHLLYYPGAQSQADMVVVVMVVWWWVKNGCGRVNGGMDDWWWWWILVVKNALPKPAENQT